MIKEILHVFSKEYKEDVKHLEFLKQNVQKMKFKGVEENVEENIERLIRENFVSNCQISVGKFD